AYQSLKRYAEAERAFKTAQRLLPDTPEPLYQLGSLYLDRGDTGPARQAFLAVQHLAPFRPEPHYGTGMTYLRRAGPGDLSKAEKEFRTAIQLDPRYSPARRELGRLYLLRRQYRQAGEQFFLAVRAAKDVESYRGMAQALAGVGRRIESEYHWGLYYTHKDLR